MNLTTLRIYTLLFCRLLCMPLVFALLCSCKHKTEYQGYVEGDLTYISVPVSGRLMRLYVDRGTPVKTGQLLFTLELQPELSTMQQALATVHQVQANLEDIKKGQRPSELAAIQAQIAASEEQLKYAKIELKRKQALVKQAGLEQEQLDQAIRDLAVAKDNLKQLQENYITATLGARIDQIKATQNQLKASEAQLSTAQWTLSQKRVSAPVDGSIFDRYYYEGEQVSAYQPVLSILDPRNIKAIFWVPETDLATLSLGQKVTIGCDSCEPMTATIRFISPQAEFTPPVIYSHETRSKLRYRIEAYFNDTDRARMHPGQPLDVWID